MIEQNNTQKNAEICNKNQCECKSSHGLYIKNRQLSWIISGTLLLNFCLFMGGYFLGQKNIVSGFSNKIDQESLSDQIYSSMCSLCDNGEIEESNENDEEVTYNDKQAPETSKETIAVTQAQDNTQATAIIDSKKDESHSLVAAADADPDIDTSDNGETHNMNVADPQYYAQLIGFGSVRSAQMFAQKLSRKEIPVVVKKRQSRTVRGRFISWYQVVTEKFNNRQELEALITKLEKEEKIAGAQIVSC